MPNAAELDFESFLPTFGLRAFRPGQRDVISVVVDGGDCLCVMPTGGGKSLCYQLPAVAMQGMTLVVSPLISLMQDQVQQLHKLGLRATYINSTLDLGEQHARLRDMAAGQFDLTYVAAERFRSPRFLEALKAANVRLLAIDEAHCISEWGHDFRPDYAKLGRFRRQIGNPPTIALTATATPDVQKDIVKQLSLREPRTFVTGFARPNLHYEVQTHWRVRGKDEALLEFLRSEPGSGIIYASTRKRCEEVAEMIAGETPRRISVYHAGMLSEDRRKAQDNFMHGAREVVVATNAFGMGINKADVRFVVHYNLPGALEAYYQEAGRAGRDGEPSRCLLLYMPADASIQEYFIESSYPSPETVAKVYDFLRGFDEDPIELTQQEIKERLGLPVAADAVRTSEQLLEKAGALERLESGQNMARVRIGSDQPTLVDFLPRQATTQRKILRAVEKVIGEMRHESVFVNPRELAAATELDGAALARGLRELCRLKDFDYVPPFRGRAVHMLERNLPFNELPIDFDALEERKAEEYRKLGRVISFAKARRCRQQEILDYFGQADNPPCGHCDNCLANGHGGPRVAGTVAAAGTATPSATAGGDLTDAGLLETVRKALSGVARTRERFGKNLVAQMLWGSQSQKISKLKLDRLSTFGLLSHLRQSEVVTLLESLILAGFLEQVERDRFRPLVKLTPRGERLMRGDEGLSGRLPLPHDLVQRLCSGKSATRQESPPKPEAAETAPVAKKIAQDHRAETTVPGSAANQTASATATAPSARQSHAATTSAAAKKTVDPHTQPTHYWTWRLLAAGFAPAECAAIRSLDRDTLFDHALRAAEAGLGVRPEWFLSADTLAVLEEVIGDKTPERIRPLMAQLPKGIRYEEVQFFVRCRVLS